ncbi:N-acetylmuramoyl-L-alanine amidase family protein [Paenibacillus sp. DMB20]|uniref:N-acetylmuramoyl-L-alanine amidase family protein n=1 Tax=Paenibacillus sp. DMB20 TaxID=1642570 RepID=UPI000627A475|nr:N-acetylmuramoyl-L-alanine amidase family protein [Paenibacillus sp. DMB20]KKO51890.1 N-acetylmuramoyl-L-alanine amidase [Paenibacillus sp. DMB20]
MKRLGLLTFLLLFLFAFPKVGEAASADGAKIFLDGEQLNLSSGVKVANVKNNILIPIRVVSENLGYKVKWDKASKSIAVLNDSKTVKMVVGSPTAEIDGNPVSMGMTPMLNGSTTLVPLRFVSTEMGMDVKWDNLEKAVYLSSEGSQNDPGAQPANPVTGNDIPANPVTTVPPLSGDPSALATIDGISFSDNRLMVAVTGNSVAPKVFTMTNPDRIVIDLPNTEFSGNFINNNMLDSGNKGTLSVTGYPDVQEIRYSLFSNSPSTIRVVIALTGAKNYAVTNMNDGMIVVDLNATSTDPGTVPVPPIGSSGKKIVVIDAGHGGSAPGKIGYSNTQEKDFTLAMALKVGALLEKQQNIQLVQTRTEDKSVGLSERAKLANDVNATIFVSIHGNGFHTSTPNGTETLYTRDSSRQLADIVHKHLIKATGLKDRKVKYQNVAVTRETKMPAILLEIGFLSNQAEEALMLDEEFQYRVAQGIVDGIMEYINLQG